MYIDLLVIENIIINYFITYSVSILLNRITTLKKVLLSSILGTIPIIFIYFNINIYLLTIISSILISIIAFSYHDILYTIKNIIYLFLVSIFLGGMIYLININIPIFRNNHIYNFILLSILSPLITIYYSKYIKKIPYEYSNYYNITIYINNKVYRVNSYLDTGNNLSYNNKPVILINKNIIKIDNINFIFVPYNTIDNNGIVKCIKPDYIYIDNIGIRDNLLIGLVDNINIEGADVILNKKLLERI